MLSFPVTWTCNSYLRGSAVHILRIFFQHRPEIAVRSSAIGVRIGKTAAWRRCQKLRGFCSGPGRCNCSSNSAIYLLSNLVIAPVGLSKRCKRYSGFHLFMPATWQQWHWTVILNLIHFIFGRRFSFSFSCQNIPAFSTYFVKRKVSSDKIPVSLPYFWPNEVIDAFSLFWCCAAQRKSYWHLVEAVSGRYCVTTKPCCY